MKTWGKVGSGISGEGSFLAFSACNKILKNKTAGTAAAILWPWGQERSWVTTLNHWKKDPWSRHRPHLLTREILTFSLFHPVEFSLSEACSLDTHSSQGLTKETWANHCGWYLTSLSLPSLCLSSPITSIYISLMDSPLPHRLHGISRSLTNSCSTFYPHL